MNELPELALIKIFDHLSISEQLKVREACKRWLVLADECLRSRSELVLFCCSTSKIPLIWNHNHQPVNLNSAVIVKDHYQTSEYFKRTFSGIQSLCLAYLVSAPEIGRLTRFVKLEHFQINDLFDFYTERGRQFKIDYSLPSLKTFHSGQTDKFVRLNCPNLEQLCVYDDFQLTEELNPLFKKFRFLKVRSFTHSPGSELPNLEVLCFCKSIEIDIANFPKLKEVHFFYHRYTRYRDEQDVQRSYERIFEFLNNLLWQTKILNRSNFETYFDGIAYRNDSKLRNRLLPAGDPNIHELYNVFSIERFEFKELVNSKIEGTMKSFYLGLLFISLLQQMSEELVEKVARCIYNLTLSPKLISLDGPRYRSLFNYVRALNVPLLPQQLLDRLPEILPNLTKIDFNHFHHHQRSYAFLGRFKALGHLKIPLEMILFDDISKFTNNSQNSLYIEFPQSTRANSFLCIVTKAVCLVYDGRSEGWPKMVNLDSKEKMFDHFIELGLLRKQFFEGFFDRNYFISEPPSPEEYFYEN